MPQLQATKKTKTKRREGVVAVYRYDVWPDCEQGLRDALVPQKQEWNRTWSAMAERFERYLEERTQAAVAMDPGLIPIRSEVLACQLRVDEAYTARNEHRKAVRSKDPKQHPVLQEAEDMIAQARREYKQQWEVWIEALKRAHALIPKDVLTTLNTASKQDLRQIVASSALWPDMKGHIKVSWQTATQCFWQKAARRMRGRHPGAPLDKVHFWFRRGVATLKGYGTQTGIPVPHVFEPKGCGILELAVAPVPDTNAQRDSKRPRRTKTMGRFRAQWRSKGLTHDMDIALHRLPPACGNIKSTMLVGNRVHRGGIWRQHASGTVREIPERWRWHLVLTIGYPGEHDTAVKEGRPCASCEARRGYSATSAAGYWQEKATQEEVPAARAARRAACSRPERSSAPACGIDLNWRIIKRPGSDAPALRLGVVVSGTSLAEPIEELFLPGNILPAYQSVRVLQEEQASAIEAIKQRISELPVPPEVTDLHREWLSAWWLMREGRLVLLYRALRESGSDSQMVHALEHWLCVHTKLHIKIRNAQTKWERRRQGYYRYQAAKLCRTYPTIVIEDLDLRRMRMKPQTEQAPALERSQQYANLVALSEFRAALQQATKNRGTKLIMVDPQGTTRRCTVCGVESESPREELIMSCPNGHRWDQDVNAAINILGRYLADGSGSGECSQASPGETTKKRLAEQQLQRSA